jgi:polar amino acid transport system permease protein
MLRLAWPSYTNEAIFLTHATTLVFFSGFPAWQQSGDALYYARYFADQTFNPFVSYPIVAVYFIGLTLAIIWLFGIHQPAAEPASAASRTPAPALSAAIAKSPGH